MSPKRANYPQPWSITRATAFAAAALVCANLLAGARPGWAQESAPAGSRPASTRLGAGPSPPFSTPLGAGWREAPAYVSLFAPSAHQASYRAYVSPAGLEATLEQILADPGILRPPGAWTRQAQVAYDAFGLSGGYNRWKVAGLYGGRRADVVRGPRLGQGQMESWTLITPYPDEALQRLEPGTLIIVLRVPSD